MSTLDDLGITISEAIHNFCEKLLERSVSYGCNISLVSVLNGHPLEVDENDYKFRNNVDIEKAYREKIFGPLKEPTFQPDQLHEEIEYMFDGLSGSYIDTQKLPCSVLRGRSLIEERIKNPFHIDVEELAEAQV